MAMHLTAGRMQLGSCRAAFTRASPVHRPRLVAARRTCTFNRLVVRAGIGQYLSEAAAAIFSPQTSDVPWDGSTSGWSGDISHHNEVAKLRKLHSVIKATRQQVAGCMDASATNYNPDAQVDDGTCEYIIQEPGKEQYTGTLGSYISDALGSVFGSNFSNSDKASAADFENTTFSYGGQKVSQRDIQRLLSFEQVVKKTLDKAEDQVEEA